MIVQSLRQHKQNNLLQPNTLIRSNCQENACEEKSQLDENILQPWVLLYRKPKYHFAA